MTDVLPYYDERITEQPRPNPRLERERLQVYLGVLFLRGLTGTAVFVAAINALPIAWLPKVAAWLLGGLLVFGFLVRSAEADHLTFNP